MKPIFSTFDAAHYLPDEETIAAYLTAVEQEGDMELLLVAVKDIVNARNMTQLAAEAGLGRASLYKALTPGATPKFETVMKLAGALGLKVESRPAHSQ